MAEEYYLALGYSLTNVALQNYSGNVALQYDFRWHYNIVLCSSAILFFVAEGCYLAWKYTLADVALQYYSVNVALQYYSRNLALQRMHDIDTDMLFYW